MGASAVLRQKPDMVDNLLRHRKSGPMISVQEASGGEAKEIVLPLFVADGAKSKGTSGLALKGVVMGFVRLRVGAKLQLIVVVVINVSASHKSGGLTVGETLLYRGKLLNQNEAA
jgi:hypothetical protein